MSDTALAERVLHSIGKDMEFFWRSAHADLVLEFPYGATNGFPVRIAGRENTHAFFANMPKIVPDLSFYDVHVTPLAEEGGFLLEYCGTCPKANNYRQRYITIMRFEDDKLILFREHWDTVEATRALARQGVIRGL
jgi:ketosteroid isomerase-like protein